MCGGFDPLDGRSPGCRCGTGQAPTPRKGLTRSAPLSRGTKGLARGAGLAQGTKGLARGSGLAQGRGLSRSAPAVSRRTGIDRAAAKPKPRAPRVAGAVRDAVLARSGGRCEVAATEVCRRAGRSLSGGGSQHHRRPGRMGGSKAAGTNEAPNLLQVCGSGTTGCHGAIESDRSRALAAGWLLHAGQDPAAEPVTLWDGRRVLLRADGYLPGTVTPK